MAKSLGELLYGKDAAERKKLQLAGMGEVWTPEEIDEFDESQQMAPESAYAELLPPTEPVEQAQQPQKDTFTSVPSVSIQQQSQTQPAPQTYSSQLDKAINEISNYKEGINWRPLLAYVDANYGGNLAGSYTAPMTDMEKNLKLAELLKQKEQLAAEKEDRALRRQLMAQRGQGADQTGLKQLNVSMAKNFAEWGAGGYSKAANQINSLRKVSQEIANKEPSKVLGYLGRDSSVRKMLSEDTVLLQQKVDKQILDSLRATLGSQFTEREGTRILNITYDPQMSWESNKAKVDALADTLDQAAAAKKQMMDYYVQNKFSMKGYNGVDPEAVVMANAGLTSDPSLEQQAQANLESGDGLENMSDEQLEKINARLEAGM